MNIPYRRIRAAHLAEAKGRLLGLIRTCRDDAPISIGDVYERYLSKEYDEARDWLLFAKKLADAGVRSEDWPDECVAAIAFVVAYEARMIAIGLVDERDAVHVVVGGKRELS